jgi:hypothetical protein
MRPRAEAKAVIARWNEQLVASRDMLWSPTIRAALDRRDALARRVLPGLRLKVVAASRAATLIVRNIACNRFSPYAWADLGHDAPQGHVRMVGPMSGTWQVTWHQPSFFRIVPGLAPAV